MQPLFVSPSTWHAGVGIGTLYRHFPTREALFEAVYRREVEQLADLAEQLK
ncbi:MAG: TetR/AcrR family transcriptional regulator, partial [Silvibacterium sp.]